MAVVMQDFRNLKVWNKSHSLTLKIYNSTRLFPKEELYGLTSQIRRSACSIGANIAEGCGRGGDASFSQFLQFAMGSASELEYHLLLARDLRLLGEKSHAEMAAEVIEVKRMLASLLQRLKPRSEN